MWQKALFLLHNCYTITRQIRLVRPVLVSNEPYLPIYIYKLLYKYVCLTRALLLLC